MPVNNLDIVHHHAFKCAGSTVMWILEKNYPKKVLYIEGRESGRRIRTGDVLQFAVGRSYRAASSHLLTIPEAGGNIAALHISFLRDPADRILSAYRYMRRNRTIDGSVSFDSFCRSDFQADNFQLKHSSIQDPQTSKGGWSVNRRIYDKIEADEIFFGLVEYFDHSLIAIEKILRDKGIHFDGAYPTALNTTSAPGRGRSEVTNKSVRAFLASKNAKEHELYEHAKQRFKERFYGSIRQRELEDFKQRCRSLAERRDARSVVVPTEKQWVYIDA